MKNVLLINDMAGYGKVALSVMLPIFSHFHFETYCLPTALISNTLDYGDFAIMDTTSYIKDTVATWKRLGFTFPFVCTGFLLSREQANVVFEFCTEQKANGAKIFVDPIMGDDGHLYNGVQVETIDNMRMLCKIADILVPNITEAALLAGVSPKEEYIEEDIQYITEQLYKLGAASVVITSIHLNSGKFNAVGSGKGSTIRYIPYSEIPVRLEQFLNMLD